MGNFPVLSSSLGGSKLTAGGGGGIFANVSATAFPIFGSIAFWELDFIGNFMAGFSQTLSFVLGLYQYSFPLDFDFLAIHSTASSVAAGLLEFDSFESNVCIHFFLAVVFV